MTGGREGENTLDLAEEVAAGRLPRAAAEARARAAGPAEAADLDDLLVALDALRLHVAATREAATIESAGASSDLERDSLGGSLRQPTPSRVRLRLVRGAANDVPSGGRPTSPSVAFAGLAAAVVLVAVMGIAVQGPLLSVGRTDRGPNASAASGSGRLALTSTMFDASRLTALLGGAQSLVLAGARYAVANDVRSSDAALWRSSDGGTWTAVESRSFGGGFITALVRDGGRLVAVGSRGPSVATGDRAPAIWTSDGGTTWARVPTGGAAGIPVDVGGLRAVALGPDGLVAVGTLGVDSPHAFAVDSADGLDWRRAPLVEGATGRGMTGITATATGFLAWGYRQAGEIRRPAIWASSGGLEWTLAHFGPNVAGPVTDPTAPDEGGEIETIIGLDGSWLALSVGPDGSPTFFRSADGVRWSESTADTELAGFNPAGVVALAPIGGAIPDPSPGKSFPAAAPTFAADRSWLVLGSVPTTMGRSPAAFTWSPTTGWRRIVVDAPPGGGSWELRTGAVVAGRTLVAGGTIAVGGTASPAADHGAIWTTASP